MKKCLSLVLAILLAALVCCGSLAESLPMYREDDVVSPYARQVAEYLTWWDCFWGSETLDLQRDELLPVYAYPSEDGWRGAKGKAAVHLMGPVTVLAYSEDEQWLLIDYETSGKAHRVGYIRRLEGVQISAPTLYALHLPLMLNRDVQVTDDPNGMQGAMAQLRQGDTVDVLGHIGYNWAYVELAVDGKPARGFIPLDALALPEETPSPKMAAYLKGVWRFIGGGEVMGYGMIFDGVDQVQVCDTDDLDEEINWLTISKEDEPLRYAVYEDVWTESGCPYVLEVTDAQGYVTRFGIPALAVYDQDSGREQLSLYYGEGGGGYERADDIEVILEN